MLQKQIKPEPPPPSSSSGSSLGNSPSNLNALEQGLLADDDDLIRRAGEIVGDSRPHGPGLVATMGTESANMAHGIVKHVWPLRACVALGERIASTGSGVKLTFAVLCAFVAVGGASGSGVEGGVLFAALAAGAVLGWYLPSLLGFALVLAAELTGLAIGLGLIALVLLLAYAVIASTFN